MQDNPDRLRSESYLARFEEYIVRADECLRLAGRYPSFKPQYEGLAHEWRVLAIQSVH